MSTIAVKKVKLGDNADTSKNFLIEVPAVADGTLTIKRENGTNILSIDATGKAVIPGVVGTVAQVGGVPTGQVVERGSNANGEYVRFADGTQICTRIVGFESVPTNSIAEAVVQFPASFAGAVYATGTLGPLTASNDVFGVTSIRDLTATSGRVTVRNGTTSAQGISAWCIIVGRWF